MIVAPVPRKSLSDSLYEQLRDAIVDGAIAPGAALPSERELAEQAGVNRQSVREATQRLRRAGLVRIVHGDGAFARNWRTETDVAVLPELVVDATGNVRIEPTVALLRLRMAVGIDIAVLAARRCTPEAEAELELALDALRALHEPAEGDTAEGVLAFETVWTALARTSQNLAYRLSQATFRATTERLAPTLRPVRRAPDRALLSSYEQLVAAVIAHDETNAMRLAREVLVASGRGLESLAVPTSA